MTFYCFRIRLTVNGYSVVFIYFFFRSHFQIINIDLKCLICLEFVLVKVE